MTQTIQIRSAQVHDISSLVEFNVAMAKETENKQLIPDLVTRGVTRVFEEPRLGFYVVAEITGRVVGSLMVTQEWSDWRNGSFWWIQSVYVRPKARHQGVFRSLYAHVKERAQADTSVCGLRLYVEQNNLIAQKTYEGIGMEATPYGMYEEIKEGLRYLKTEN